MKRLQRPRINSSIAVGTALVMALSGCAVNPQTGQLQPSQAMAGLGHRITHGFKSIYDSPNPCSNNDRNIAMTVGAIAGGVIGYLNHGAKGAIVGAAVGAGGGFLVGHLMDARRCKLYKIAQANHLRLVSATITPGKLGLQGTNPSTAIGLDVQLQNRGDEFQPGTATLTPQARTYLAQIAGQYTPGTIAQTLPANATPPQRAQAKEHVVLIVGHTDAQDAASGADLAKLSQARARAVAQVFARNGVPAANIFYQGAGDALPIASNATAQGREANNRVQFVDVPTKSDLQHYLRGRTVNPIDYGLSKMPTVAASAAGSTEGAATVTARKRPGWKRPGRPTRVAGVSYAKRERIRRIAREKHLRHAVFVSGYNFGGGPIRSTGKTIDLGAPLNHSMFHIVSEAHADAPVLIGSCLTDRPRPATAVRNLETGRALPPRDFVPGFYGTAWATDAKGNLVAITNATVPLDSGASIPDPTVYIYRNYHGNIHQKPSFVAKADVNVYRGSLETVYRVFLHGPAQCLDLVVPSGEFAGPGNLYYANRGDQYLATPQFAMQSVKR
ncbi:MAG: OmpA family protein [Betaproteobacteria bacterium]|nr:OmpA family protein [Betaproteobacteria bacterium]